MDSQRQLIEKQVQQRNQYFQEYPKLVQRRGAHRCMLCRTCATSAQIADADHWRRLLEWEAQDLPAHLNKLRRVEHQEGMVLGPARGAPRVSSSSTTTQQPVQTLHPEDFEDVLRGEAICLLCETPVQAGHRDTEEHRSNLQSWMNMSSSGRGKYMQHAAARWQYATRQARGGMQRQQDTLSNSHDMSPDAERHLEQLEEEPTDHELATALQAIIYEEQEHLGSDVDGLWAVLCQSSTREYTIRCRLESRIRDI